MSVPAVGAHTIGVYVDWECKIVEFDETNNISGPASYEVVGPDLTISSLSVEAPPAVNQPFTMTKWQHGSAAAPLSAFPSTASLPPWIPSLAAGATKLTKTLTVSNNRPFGDCYADYIIPRRQ